VPLTSGVAIALQCARRLAIRRVSTGMIRRTKVILSNPKAKLENGRNQFPIDLQSELRLQRSWQICYRSSLFNPADSLGDTLRTQAGYSYLLC
jgi:hypothetical protein